MITSNVVPVMVPVSARSHLMNMSVPLGSQSTVLDPSNPFPTDGTASARHPVSYFTVALTQPSLVVVHMKEGNTASRCALFLSCSCPKPDANNAAWRLISPEPHKQIVLHPADPAYRVGVLHIAVHYLEPSGHSHFQLQARVQPDFFAMWLRTGGEIARAGPTAAADSMNTAKSLRQFGVATVVPTLHATLAASAARPTGTAAPAAGAPFSSLYVGDWRGDQRDGLGFQYYAAPEEVSLRMTAAMEDVQDLEHEYTQTSGSGTRSLGATNTSSTFAASAAGVDVAQPLLLLRAFSERHNLPWSAWSIPDTLTPEELARLGFGFCFRSASSARAGKAAAGTSPTAVAASGRSATVASPSRGAAAAAAVALPPTPPAAPCPTAAEGIAALGAAINSFMVSEIMGGDVEAWQVLPVRPGVEVYAGEWVANQKEGSGAYQWLDRSYVGDWVAGRREGHGLLRRQDGSWYRGQWRRHVPHGRGEARLMPDGLVHRGEWCDGRRHGAGALTYPNGMTVEGVWVDDELQARVRVVYRDGSTYDGLWDAVEACRQGQGTWTDTHGCRHMHEWDRDVCVGPGREAYPNGVVLEGVWTAGELADGTYVFPNGDRHMGDMDASLHVRDGAGSTVSADGLAVYTGAWSGDKRSGRGTQTVQRLPKAGGDAGEAGASPAMERYEGEWRDNMRSGRGRLTDGDDVYEGEFALDCRDGVGVHRNTRTGSFYEGSWKANHRCGAGTYYCATHDTTYEGVFLHDRLTGLGTATNGTTDERYSGSWLDGLQQGHGSLRLANGDVLRGVWHRGAPGAATTVEYTEAEQFADRSCLAGAGESRYVGGWKDGVREGTGTQVFRDGSVYEGAWRANKQHGHGRRTTAAGESVACEWRDGHIVGGGTGEAHFADGSVYRGPVNVAGVPDGVGVLTYPDGTVFDGRFVDGIYQL